MTARLRQQAMPWGQSVLGAGRALGTTHGSSRQITLDALDLPLRIADEMPDRIRAAAGSGLLRTYSHKGETYAAIRREGYPYDDAVSAHFQGARCGKLNGRWRDPAGRFFAEDIEALLKTALYLGST
jgi:hypothetical protein